MARVEYDTFYLTTGTNGNGFFSLAHGLCTSAFRIDGIIVAIQHKNNNWHTLEYSHNVDNRFWWNDTHVEGLIASPDFYNRAVRIIVFAHIL